MSDDPDEDLDAAEDPFEELRRGEEGTHDPKPENAAGEGAAGDDAADDRFGPGGSESAGGSEPVGVDAAVGADTAGGTDPRGEDPFTSPDSIFEDVDVGEFDADAVWRELEEAESRGSVSEGREKKTYAEVSKHAFCKGCEHLSGPPDLGCTHEGTEILEFVDPETVRVVDCPIVEERRRLEEET